MNDSRGAGSGGHRHDPEDALLRGHKTFVVTVEIRLAGKSALQAEATILNMLEWVKQYHSTDFNIDTWQSTGVEDDFSQAAKAYGIHRHLVGGVVDPQVLADRRRPVAELEADVDEWVRNG